MTIKEQIAADFTEAFKTKQTEKKNFLGVLKSEIFRVESNPVEAEKFKTNEELVLSVVKKMEKSLISTESTSELEFLKAYLPALMSEDVIREKVRLIIIESGNKNIGALMGMFNKQNAGQAFDNKVVSQIIKEEIA